MKLPPFNRLVRTLLDGDDPDRALSGLLRLAAEELASPAAALLETEPGGHGRLATAGYGLTALPGSALTPADARTIEAAVRGRESVRLRDVTRDAPSLARLLGTAAAVVAHVPRTDPTALLAVGLAAEMHADAGDVRATLESFAVGLEWLRLRRGREMQRAVQNLVRAFAQGLSAMPSLGGAFERLCVDARALFLAQRATLWIHDRRARQLELAGWSDTASREESRRVGSDDLRHPACRGLRLERPEFSTGSDATPNRRTLLVPLRGRRRALGTLVLEALEGPPSGRAILVDAAGDLGRQLSTAIENVDLLAEVLRSRQELENTFNSLVDLVAVCDREGRIVQVNESLARRLGGTVGSFSDRPLSDLVGPAISAFVTEEARTVAPREASSREIEDATLGGTFSVSVAALVNHDNERIGTVVVARDVTDQVRLEAERTALRQQLAQSEKLAALGQFVAGIAHELNNPLQGVLGNLELMQETGGLTTTQKRDLRTVHREAERAARIVRNLLVFAGSGRRLQRRYSVNALVGRVVSQRMRALRKAGVEVVKTLDDRIPRLVGSPLLLQQALLNLIINAEQAMSGGPGRLQVATRLSVSADCAIIEIRDSGPGLPDEVQRRLFEPFFTTKDVGQGTGLGLALAYGIVHDHGGTIAARNHPAGGAVFTIEIPTDKMVIK